MAWLGGASSLDVACPKCGAEPGAKCRTMRTRRSTDTHSVREIVRWSSSSAHRCTCQPPSNEQLDRTLCACGSMHFYCECGRRTDDCPLDA